MKLRCRGYRLKGSGCYIRVLPSARDRQHAELSQSLRTAVAEYIESHDGGLAGFALVVWDVESRSSAAAQIGAGSGLNVSQIPQFAAERLRRSIAMQDAEGLVNEALGVPDEAS